MREKNEMDMLTVTQIVEEYGYSKRLVYMLLKIENCPFAAGGNNTKYWVLRKKWDAWLETVNIRRTA